MHQSLVDMMYRDGDAKGRLWEGNAGLTGERECQRPGGLDRKRGPTSTGSQRALGLKLKMNLG